MQHFPIPCPITDLESDTNSLSGQLCHSFEGLLKKEDLDEQTRCTLWNQKAGVTIEQNQCGLSSEAQAFFGMNAENKERRLFEKIECQINRKQQEAKMNDLIHHKNSDKMFQKEKIQSVKPSLKYRIQSYRSLLPAHYRLCLPQNIKFLLKTASLLDSELLKRKSASYTQNIQNLFKHLFCESQISQVWSAVKKIIYLDENFYSLKVDPLKNLCLGFGSVSTKQNRKNDTKRSCKTVEQRQQRLRRRIFQYWQENIQLNIEYSKERSLDLPSWDISQAIVQQPKKITKFFPQNLNITYKQSKSNSPLPQSLNSILPQKINQQKKLNPKFQSQLKSLVRQRQSSQSFTEVESHSTELSSKCTKFQQSQAQIPCLNQFQRFLDIIQKIYAKKAVSHLYKVTLIENLRKQCQNTLSLEKIFFFMKFLLSQGLFLQVLIKSGCQILKIVQNQKQIVMDQLRQKNIYSKEQEQLIKQNI